MPSSTCLTPWHIRLSKLNWRNWRIKEETENLHSLRTSRMSSRTLRTNNPKPLLACSVVGSGAVAQTCKGVKSRRKTGQRQVDYRNLNMHSSGTIKITKSISTSRAISSQYTSRTSLRPSEQVANRRSPLVSAPPARRWRS